MKKYSGLILVLSAFLLVSCGNNKKSDNTNILGGNGELNNMYCTSGRRGLYDDENIYLIGRISDSLAEDVYIKLTKDNEVCINCDVATCDHSGDTGECKALAASKYFKFNGKLYKYGEDNYIRDAETKEGVFKNQRPDGITDVDQFTDITNSVRILDDKYLKLDTERYTELLDENLNLLYVSKDAGFNYWGKVMDNKFYHFGSAEELIETNLDTGEEKVIELEGNVKNGEGEGDYLYYINNEGFLYRYSLITGENVKLSEERMQSFDFTVRNGYIYCQSCRGARANRMIFDTDGNLIRDCTDYEKMDMERACEYNGKIYYLYYDYSNSEKHDVYVAVMNADGSDYREYKME